MSHIQPHHVSVQLKKDYEFIVRFDDVPGAPTLTCDEPEPLGRGHGPDPAALLGAAVGNCLAASLAFCLRKVRWDPIGLTAHVTTRVGRNQHGRSRIVGIDVVLAPEFGEAGAGSQTRGAALFEDFCTVTASIRHGIPVSVSLSGEAKTAA